MFYFYFSYDWFEPVTQVVRYKLFINTNSQNSKYKTIVFNWHNDNYSKRYCFDIINQLEIFLLYAK